MKIDSDTKAKLRDPAYFALHFQAIMVLREVSRFAWYDSFFLRSYAAAIRFLQKVRPDAVAQFVAGFSPLRPDPNFSATLVRDAFDSETHAKILEASSVARPQTGAQQDYENQNFGRDVVWDEPLFRVLQEHIRPRLEHLIGRPIEASYTFLSRYRGNGVCAPHLDHPNSMFTFDYCIDQSAEWPIHFSKVVDWPTEENAQTIDLNTIKNDPAMNFKDYTLRPGDAVLFNGSSQWHYRDPITPGGYCNLLFFHYIPEGCGDLVEPRRWDLHFGIPELGALCDLFESHLADRTG